ncbi:MAG: hypothetical protein RRC07_05350 [Anaerolineae bacterium]|nr:hypothetical protein [Anaerolineae bacterium]
MKSFETWRTWLIIIGLLVFGAVASVAWPAIVDSINLDFDLSLAGRSGEVEQESGSIPLPAWLAGLPGVDAVVDDSGGVHPLLVFVVLAALFVGLIAGAGIVLGLLVRVLDRQVRQVKSDSEFQESAAALARREQERLRARSQSQPSSDMPAHQHPRWSVVATSLVVLFFVLLLGFALADTLYPSGPIELASGRWVDPAVPWSIGLVVFALLLILVVVRSRGAALGGNENQPVSWNMIWVVITGLVFLGIGIGLTLAIRGAAAAGG